MKKFKEACPICWEQRFNGMVLTYHDRGKMYCPLCNWSRECKCIECEKETDSKTEQQNNCTN